MIPFDPHALALWLATLWWPFVRAMALFYSAPVFGSPAVPRKLRIGLSILVAFIVQPLIPHAAALGADSWPVFLVLTLQQIIIGALLGLAVRIIFAAVNFAGAVIGLEMGLGFATLMDPKHGVSVPTLSSFLGLFATLIFLSLNGHLLLIAAFAKSFTVAPPSMHWHFGPGAWYAIVKWGGQLFLLGLVMALPVLTVLVAANLSLGVLAKIAPQLNIFVVGFPVLLLIGLVGLYFTAPLLGRAMVNAFNLSLGLTRSISGF